MFCPLLNVKFNVVSLFKASKLVLMLIQCTFSKCHKIEPHTCTCRTVEHVDISFLVKGSQASAAFFKDFNQ